VQESVMDVAPTNPPSNSLPAGMSPEQLDNAIAKSGYPLQVTVGNLLRKFPSMYVSDEWNFIDPDTNDIRSLDILASHQHQKWSININVTTHVDLLIECKYNIV
jgi:hypothetical protein